MEKAKFIMMSISTLFVLIAGTASAWMACALPEDDPNVMFFSVAAAICFLAAVWFGVNVWHLFKNN